MARAFIMCGFSVLLLTSACVVRDCQESGLKHNKSQMTIESVAAKNQTTQHAYHTCFTNAIKVCFAVNREYCLVVVGCWLVVLVLVSGCWLVGGWLLAGVWLMRG